MTAAPSGMAAAVVTYVSLGLTADHVPHLYAEIAADLHMLSFRTKRAREQHLDRLDVRRAPINTLALFGLLDTLDAEYKVLDGLGNLGQDGVQRLLGRFVDRRVLDALRLVA